MLIALYEYNNIYVECDCSEVCRGSKRGGKFKSMRYKISARNESSIRCFIIILGLIRTEKLRFNPFNNSNN